MKFISVCMLVFLKIYASLDGKERQYNFYVSFIIILVGNSYIDIEL
jgi:hypothetical protein